MRKSDRVYRSDDFYIGDKQRQVMQKYAFMMQDGNSFQMETSINDSLMVVCNDDFYVCPHCGEMPKAQSETWKTPALILIRKPLRENTSHHGAMPVR